MRKRVNRREKNLANVSPDKAEADELNTSGLFFNILFLIKQPARNIK